MIKEILDEQLKSESREAIEHKDRLYPTHSSALIDYRTYKRIQGRCLRSAYYHCMGVPETSEWKYNSHLIMKLGDYTESMLLDMLKAKGVLKDSGVKFEIPKYNIYGKADAVIDYLGRDVGVEIKSIGGNNKYAINGIYGSQYSKPFPKWQNLFQTLIYCYAFRETISEFILLYIRRDTCEIQEFVISIAPENDIMYPVINGEIERGFSVTGILERYSLLYDFIIEGKVPPRDFVETYPKEAIPIYSKLGIISKKQAENYNSKPFGDFECAFCGYKDVCNGDK